MKVEKFYKKSIFISILFFIFSLMILNLRPINLEQSVSGGLSFSFLEKDKDEIISLIKSQLKSNEFKVKKNLSDSGLSLEILPQKGNLEEIKNNIFERLKQKSITIYNFDIVQSSIARTILENSIISVILALIFVSIYVFIRFDLIFSVVSLISLSLNILLVLSILNIINIELNLTAITAILTIVGYCINDTIIVFDKIKQVFLQKEESKINDIINNSIKSVLTRTILTSFTTLAVNLTLLFILDYNVRTFSLLFGLGLIIGTFFSIFLITALIFVMKKDLNTLKPKIFNVKDLNT